MCHSSPRKVYTLTIRNTGGRHETAGLEGDLNVTSTAHRLIVQGAGLSTVIDASQLQDRVFQIVHPGTVVVFWDLAIRGGLAQDDGSNGALAGSTDALGGGMLDNGGEVTLDHVVLQNNVARGGDSVYRGVWGRKGCGGGLYATGGSLSVSDSNLGGNQATGGRGGDGGPFQYGGSGGDALGGGIYSTGGLVSLASTMISGNTARGGTGGDAPSSTTYARGPGGGGGGQGGGVYASGGMLTLTNTTVYRNNAYGGALGNSTVVGKGFPGRRSRI